MKRIWNDPVGSKVIAGLILGGISLSATAAYKYWSTTDSEDRSFYSLLVSSSIELNSFIVISLVTFLVSVVLLVLFLSNFKTYDVFLSAPMSFDTEEEYQEVRNCCLQIIDSLKEHTPFEKVYYAGHDKETKESFTAANHAAIDDLKALKKSKRLILYMPRKIPTSAIFEAGYAFRKTLPTIYLCHNDNDLPFLMKELNGCFRSVNKYADPKFEKLLSFIKLHGKKLFDKSI